MREREKKKLTEFGETPEKSRLLHSSYASLEFGHVGLVVPYTQRPSQRRSMEGE